VEKQRNERGQWVAGVSGNHSGRPRKKAVLPKSLTDHLADAMMQKIPVIDGEGKQQMMPAFEAAARQLVGSIPSLKPKDLITALRYMDGLHVFDEMRTRAGECPTGRTLEQARERIRAKMAQIRETQAAAK